MLCVHLHKQFEGIGSFVGRIVSYDGEHYRVYYSADEDEEDLSESELDDLEFMDDPQPPTTISSS